MTPLRFVYFGTPRFARIVLDELKDAGLLPSLIVTTPPKPQGRHLVPTQSEVHTWGKEHNISVEAPDRIDESLLERLREEHADCFVVAAYGKILPQALLDIPPFGVMNVHPSLLPKFRGASPIESAILSDEMGTGVSIMLLDADLDHGPVLAQKNVVVHPWPPKGSLLTDVLAHEGGKLLAHTLPRWTRNEITPNPQDHTAATFTKKIQKADGEISPDGDPQKTYKKIQAFDEWPGAFYFIEKGGRRLRIKVVDAELRDGKLYILKIVPEGGKLMEYEDFMRNIHKN
jgi:methionyl-tRNA formyltransferase